MNKKVFLVVILVIIVVVIALLAPPITSKGPDQLKAVPAQSPISKIATPRPTPFLKIDKDSDLSVESKKLNIPEYQNDYDGLDKTVAGF